MYIHRTIEKTICETSKHFKVLLITGARQVGKSTVLKKCDPDRTYVTLDNPIIRELAITDPEMFFQRFTPPILIDEIQYAPNLLQYIKIAVDNSEENGNYWLTGSQQFNMMKNVSESLAGRVGILNLMGFSLSEINEHITYSPFLPTNEFISSARKSSAGYNLKQIYEIIWRGAYPAINTDKAISWDIFYSSYLQTYLERDIKDMTSVSSELSFLQFIKIVAARTGQMLNYADIASAAGISQPTAKAWLSLLISSGIVYLLEPYYSNINKRIIKTPKIYFTDTGLCSYLTGWNNPEVLENGAMSGAFFETFVVNEIIKSYKHNGLNPHIYYYRDKDKAEIDIIIEANGKLYPIEIKKTGSPDKSMVKSFKIIPEKMRGEGCVICLAQEDLPLCTNVNIIPVGYL